MSQPRLFIALLPTPLGDHSISFQRGILRLQQSNPHFRILAAIRQHSLASNNIDRKKFDANEDESFVSEMILMKIF